MHFYSWDPIHCTLKTPIGICICFPKHMVRILDALSSLCLLFQCEVAKVGPAENNVWTKTNSSEFHEISARHHVKGLLLLQPSLNHGSGINNKHTQCTIARENTSLEVVLLAQSSHAFKGQIYPKLTFQICLFPSSKITFWLLFQGRYPNQKPNSPQ